ncbi:MAG: ABC transporter ATP-binding protein/permease [Bifidobacteriaceae bacterium]|jgi:ATP-binding cassette subfamily B protein|nr:ABC transporter ATP-binding protein/permease [Bifidobacteriaceae bacterium]
MSQPTAGHQPKTPRPDQPKTPSSAQPKIELFAAARGRFGAIVGLTLVGSALSVAQLVAIVHLTRALWPGVTGGQIDAARVWWAVGAAGAALVGAFAASGAATLVGHLADADLQLDVRRRIVAHLRRLPLGWFDQRSSGAVKKAALNDVAALHQLVAHALHDLVRGIAVPLASLGYLLAVEWRMGLAAAVPLVISLALYSYMMGSSTKNLAAYNASAARLNAATVEYVHGIAVVKSFGQAGASHRRYADETRVFERVWTDWARQTQVVETLVLVISSPVVVLTYLLGIAFWLTSAGTIEPIDAVPAILLGLGLTAPIIALGSSGQFVREATKAAGSLKEFLATPPITQPAHPQAPAGSGVAVEQVSFTYDAAHLALDSVTATSPAGTLTALVGASGSGKSTLARLIPRFYDATAGTVRLGEVDVRRLAEADVHGQVGFVFQDTYLLRASVLDNIRLARPDASVEDVERAARAAQIHDRIARLPRGYDSVVGHDAHFSGGEAQRVMIARALICDAPVLVLDEATAFADPDSEAAIQDALSNLAAGRTVVVIAHRLHTVTGADAIWVLDGGRLVERGRHPELVAADGRYRRLWDRYEAFRRTAAQGVGGDGAVGKPGGRGSAAEGGGLDDPTTQHGASRAQGDGGEDKP